MDARLKVGLEIHQQLDTRKLFCECPSELSEAVVARIQRRLRPAAGETGEVDCAALHEGTKGLEYVYELTAGTCAVEVDEEPPRPAREEAIDAALTVALMLDAKPVDELHFMRKIVVDGSNTTGFQRTALVATGGKLEVGGKEVAIPTICLEEDAGRKISASEGTVTYRLDRLGIPLIEVATEPSIDSPEMAREAALAIGQLLHDAGRAKRGIGTIREDVNISVPGGARVEIKGVQELNSIADRVRGEVERQERLLSLAAELRARGDSGPWGDPVDVTAHFQTTASKVLKTGLAIGGKIFGVRLPGFRSLLKKYDFGSELAQRVRVVGLRGLFHTDELPGYGITAAEVEAVEKALGCGKGDAFIVLVAGEEQAGTALRMVVARARAALSGVPEETRDPLPDSSTSYSRPLAGEARMYPETDVPVVEITKERLESLRRALPKKRREKVKEYADAHEGLSHQMIEQMVSECREADFLEVRGHVGPGVQSSTILSALLYDPSSGKVPSLKVKEVFKALELGRFSKEAVGSVLHFLAEHPDADVNIAVTSLDLATATRDEVDAVVREVVEKNLGVVMERGEGAKGPLMGEAMRRLRGKADGRTVSEALERAMKAAMPPS